MIALNKLSEKDCVSALSKAVIKSGMRENDKLFFTSGLYRFYMDLLNFTDLYNLDSKVKSFCKQKRWSIPCYPMNIKKEAD